MHEPRFLRTQSHAQLAQNPKRGSYLMTRCLVEALVQQESRVAAHQAARGRPHPMQRDLFLPIAVSQELVATCRDSQNEVKTERGESRIGLAHESVGAMTQSRTPPVMTFFPKATEPGSVLLHAPRMTHRTSSRRCEKWAYGRTSRKIRSVLHTAGSIVPTSKDGTIEVSSILAPQSRFTELEQHLGFYFAGFSRMASEVAQEQPRITPHREREAEYSASACR
jgi:hypothetical protein